MKQKSLWVWAIVAALLVQSVEAIPPPLPSAGIVERELEREYEQEPLEPDKELPQVQIDIPKERLHLPRRKKVFIRNLKIQGNDSLSQKEIVSYVSCYLNQDLCMSKIYEICSRIEELYAKKGYFLARAYPPPQTLRKGILIIEVVEGKLGNIEILGNKYYKDSFIRGYFSSLQGKSLRYDKFLKALLLLNENSDLAVGAVFEKGKEVGYADLVLRVKDKRPIHLYLNGNNYGKNLTTNIRAGGRLDAGNLFFQGDKFSFAGVVGFPVNALYFTDAIYRVPLNRKGSSLEGAYLFSKFKIEELTSLDLKGSSNIATLKFNQACMRTRSISADFFTSFDYKQIKNYVLDQVASFDKLRVLTVGGLVDHYEPLKGRDYLMLRAGAGIPNFLGGLHAVDSECSRIGGGGRFFLFNIDYDRLQHLPYDCYFYFHSSFQLSFNKLTLPEQIYIGGVDTVRGFPLAVGLGDSGYYLNCEFRFPPPILANKFFFRFNKKWKDIFQFDLFLDQGGVFLNGGKDLFLWGTGLGVRINGPYTLALTIDVGFPLNHRDLSRPAFTYLKLTGQPF